MPFNRGTQVRRGPPRRGGCVDHKRTLIDLTRRLDVHLTPWFRDGRLATISTADVRAYISHRQDEVAATASINLELANLKRLFTLAMQAGQLLHRPYIPMLKEDNPDRPHRRCDAVRAWNHEESRAPHLPVPRPRRSTRCNRCPSEASTRAGIRPVPRLAA